MKALILGLVVTLVLTASLFFMLSGAAIVEAVAWAGRRRAGRKD